MLIRAIITDGTTADCSQLIELIKDLKGKYLIADKGYDSNEIVEHAKNNGFIPVIPPRKSRNNPRDEVLGIANSKNVAA